LRSAGLALAIFAGALSVQPAAAQEPDPRLLGEIYAFYGTKALVGVASERCYVQMGLDAAYPLAAENWNIRNIAYVELADRVLILLGQTTPDSRNAAEAYGTEQARHAFDAAADASAYCATLLLSINAGAFDIAEQYPEQLRRIQAVGADR
jgi:hypothetical protein